MVGGKGESGVWQLGPQKEGLPAATQVPYLIVRQGEQLGLDLLGNFSGSLMKTWQAQYFLFFCVRAELWPLFTSNPSKRKSNGLLNLLLNYIFV